jgi:ribonuclease BN (tRNA processing enzyme)
MKVTIIGSSDAFGSGGRLHTCFHVATVSQEFLIDCGATALTGLEREGLAANRIGTILITHLHGDHFGGLVWWLIHANHVTGRTEPLTITGPAGLEARFWTAAEALYPNSRNTPRRFDLTFVAYEAGKPLDVNGIRVTPFEVSHPSGATPYALRIEAGGKTVSFSGDTEWVETLVPAAAEADLFICECFAFEREARYHLNWRTIERELPRLTARRVLLTHMGLDMLANMSTVSNPRITWAEDGMVLEI